VPHIVAEVGTDTGRTLADTFSGLSGEERMRAWIVGQTLAARDLGMQPRNDGACAAKDDGMCPG
jgi:hypothetical protein